MSTATLDLKNSAISFSLMLFSAMGEGFKETILLFASQRTSSGRHGLGRDAVMIFTPLGRSFGSSERIDLTSTPSGFSK